MIRIMELAHEALLSGGVISKRYAQWLGLEWKGRTDNN
jgi:hypothetical protein